MSPQTLPWSRAIALMDLNAFFASIEQRDFPKLQGKPVAVTNGAQGTCIITCSYEARQFGIKTGMRLYEAYKLCPSLIQRPSRPYHYAQISHDIMHALQMVTPDIEVSSVDEAFLDLTYCQQYWGSPEFMGHKIKEVVYDTTGLLCSVGVAADKTTAKYAANVKKPDGLVIVPPGQAHDFLADVPVTKLCGINKGIGRFLATYGVFVCGDMPKIPISLLARRFGHLGRKIWLMCQGLDPDKVCTTLAPPKTLGHGKVLPPNTQQQHIILNYLAHMSEKLTFRLRKHNLSCAHYFIGFKTQHTWLGGRYKLVQPNHDGRALFQLCQFALQQDWQGQTLKQVQLTALNLQEATIQGDLFLDNNPKIVTLNQTMDQINARFGKNTLQRARFLQHNPTPDVIAPAWRPDGERRSV